MPRPINALRYVSNSGKTLRLELLKDAITQAAAAVPIVPSVGEAVVVEGRTYVVRVRTFNYDTGYLDINVEG